MKAWHVDDGDEWCVLVFAATRSRAKMIFRENCPASFNYDYEWTDIHARRYPELDGMIDHERIYESPDELPEGVTFWRDHDEYGL